MRVNIYRIDTITRNCNENKLSTINLISIEIKYRILSIPFHVCGVILVARVNNIRQHDKCLLRVLPPSPPSPLIKVASIDPS